MGIGLVAVSLSLLTLTGAGGGEANSGYSLSGMIIFEGIAVCVGLLLVLSHLIDLGDDEKAARMRKGASNSPSGTASTSREDGGPTPELHQRLTRSVS